MAKVKIHIWHNANGEIVAVGRPIGATKCVPLSGEDQSVLETEIEEEHIASLHRTHVIDVSQKTVVEHSQLKRSNG
jgi:hypothetical protein